MWVGTALSEPNGLCRIKLLLRDFDSSSEWELEPVHPKKKKPILPAPLVLDLGELDAIEHPPMSQDAPMLQVQASSTQSMSTPSSIGIDEALRTVLLAVAKCEAKVEEQQRILAQMLIIVKKIEKKIMKDISASALPDRSVLDQTLPLKSYEDLQAFEGKLAADPDLKLNLSHGSLVTRKAGSHEVRPTARQVAKHVGSSPKTATIWV
ncbi:hypothetical protein Pcinc_011968 [Petrolisthes cinctipes]|uniref:Uncharacterized protein n=1 Tax=Petrolisthes cinctipes TaxID=88211 RepID=A0AAE1G217_PETCI|nr:hypothetical protein Pcinc_011968 [Petrolisthes cinctipes]